MDNKNEKAKAITSDKEALSVLQEIVNDLQNNAEDVLTGGTLSAQKFLNSIREMFQSLNQSLSQYDDNVDKKTKKDAVKNLDQANKTLDQEISKSAKERIEYLQEILNRVGRVLEFAVKNTPIRLACISLPIGENPNNVVKYLQVRTAQKDTSPRNAESRAFRNISQKTEKNVELGKGIYFLHKVSSYIGRYIFQYGNAMVNKEVRLPKLQLTNVTNDVEDALNQLTVGLGKKATQSTQIPTSKTPCKIIRPRFKSEIEKT